MAVITREAAELLPPTRRSSVRQRELLSALVLKELKVKYKRSVLGVFWSLLTPIALTGIYLFVFVYVYKVPKPDFVLLLLSGLLPWNYFNISSIAATLSLVDSGPLIRKVYFPRHLLPISIVFSNLFNLLVGLVVLVVFLAFAGRPVWGQLHWLLFAVFLETFLLMGLALFLSISNVYFRDIQQLISILILTLFFATPVVYELSDVPQVFRNILLINPMTPVMEIYRSALFHARSPDLGLVMLGVVQAAGISVLGYGVFRRYSPFLAKEV